MGSQTWLWWSIQGRRLMGLRPSFSAHVRIGERGAPVRFPLTFIGVESCRCGTVPLSLTGNRGCGAPVELLLSQDPDSFGSGSLGVNSVQWRREAFIMPQLAISLVR